MTRAAALEAAWDARVRANREQVARCSEVEAAADFYAPSIARFVEDPRRTDDPVLAELRRLARPDDVWMDVGAGAGRFALPLALVVRELIAVEPSPAMRAGLAAGMQEHKITNVRVVDARWPMEEPPTADVALIAHVGYDVEPIGPFLDALERSATRICVAVMMQPSPAGAAAAFWPPVHGEERILLPALDELVALLGVRGAAPAVTRVEHRPRSWADRESALDWLRSQLWIAPDGDANARLRRAFEALSMEDDDGLRLRTTPSTVGVVTWTSPGHEAHLGQEG